MTTDDTNALNLLTISGEPNFFAMMPAMTLELSNGALKLYQIIKLTAGESGACWKNQGTLQEELARDKGNKASRTSLRKWRDELVEKGYITLTYIDMENGQELDPDDLANRSWHYHIDIVNRWDENRALFDSAFRQRWLNQQEHEADVAWLRKWWNTIGQRGVTDNDRRLLGVGSKNDPWGEGSKNDPPLGEGEGSKNDPKEDPLLESDPKGEEKPNPSTVAGGNTSIGAQKTFAPKGNRSMEYSQEAGPPQDDLPAMKEEDHPSGLVMLLRREVDNAKGFAPSFEDKLAEPVWFVPEGELHPVQAPSPIELWELTDDYPKFVRKRIEWFRSNPPNKVWSKAIVGALMKDQVYAWFHRDYGIPGIGDKKPRVNTPDMVDGEPLRDDYERNAMTAVKNGVVTLEEAKEAIRSRRKELDAES